MSLGHWIYALGTIVVVITMLFRKNVVIPCILFTFLIGYAYLGSIVGAVAVAFNAQLAALTELGSIFLIIALMFAMLKALSVTGADQMLVAPVRKLMISPAVSYLVIAIATYVISLFFWPTPAVPLVGALLVPAAIKAGLPPMAAAVAISLAGQGMALSSDMVIQAAPGLSSAAAGVPVNEVTFRAGILSAIIGIVSLTVSYFTLSKDIKTFNPKDIETETAAETKKNEEKKGAPYAPFLVALLVLSMAAVIFAMITLQIRGGDAAALLGGTAVAILVVATLAAEGIGGFDVIADHFTAGLCFAFNVMGQILPIAGFFFLGNPNAVVKILGEGAPGFLFDIGQMVSQFIPAKGLLSGFGLLGLGIITALDGSGFAGLPMVGTLAGAIASGDESLAATLAAIGQMGCVWTGGGTIIAWSSLVAVAGVVGVPVMDLARRNLIPVAIGWITAIVFGILFLT